MEKWSVSQVCEFLASEDFDEEVVELFRVNKIRGRVFKLLKEEDLKQLGLTALGDRRLLLHLLQQGGVYGDEFEGQVPECIHSFSSTSTSEVPLSSEIEESSNEQHDSFETSSDRLSFDEPLVSSNLQGQPTLAADEQLTPSSNSEETYLSSQEILSVAAEVNVATSITSNVPARALGWEDGFEVPKQFGLEIMALLDKKMVTPKVRNHIVREVATRMLDHCLYPTDRQYQVVAAKVVRQFPVLADKQIGTGHSTVEGQLRNRFKNVRKVPSRLGLTTTKPPPLKKLRLEVKHPAVKISDEKQPEPITYKRHIEYMKKYPINVSKLDFAIKLMRETRNRRAQWIKESKPQVPAILEEFPYLRNNKIVMEELKQLTGLTNSPDDVMALKWNEWQPKVLTYAMALNRSCLKDLTEKVRQSIPNECLGILAVQVASRMLNRFKACEKQIIDFIEEGTDIERAIAEHGTNPYILCTGEDIYHVDQFIIIAEKTVVSETRNLWKAIASMITWYYIADIIYPPQCANTLLFIEKVLLNLPMSAKMNNSAICILSAIENMDVTA